MSLNTEPFTASPVDMITLRQGIDELELEAESARAAAGWAQDLDAMKQLLAALEDLDPGFDEGSTLPGDARPY